MGGVESKKIREMGLVPEDPDRVSLWVTGADQPMGNWSGSSYI